MQDGCSVWMFQNQPPVPAITFSQGCVGVSPCMQKVIEEQHACSLGSAQTFMHLFEVLCAAERWKIVNLVSSLGWACPSVTSLRSTSLASHKNRAQPAAVRRRPSDQAAATQKLHQRPGNAGEDGCSLRNDYRCASRDVGGSFE